MAAPNLERFKLAQVDRRSGFDAALAEIRAGGKRGHWIWYLLPQLSGLGTSHRRPGGDRQQEAKSSGNAS